MSQLRYSKIHSEVYFFYVFDGQVTVMPSSTNHKAPTNTRIASLTVWFDLITATPAQVSVICHLYEY